MRVTVAYTVFVLALAGCGNTASEDILPPNCRNFQIAVEDGSVNIGRHFKSAMETLRGITNSNQRALCYTCWVDKLCKLDVGDLEYQRQAYCIREVLDATRDGDSMVDEYQISDLWMEVVVDSRLKGLAWGQKQLERLKPTVHTGASYDYGNGNSFSRWNSSEYSQWKYCYCTAWGSYQNSLARIEGAYFDSMCRGRAVSAMARKNAQKKIEKFLGRKMRSEEERLRVYEAAKAEIEAVYENKVGPVLNKIRPAVKGKK